jgi:hypothetical protein
MALTKRHHQLAQAIDKWVVATEADGGVESVFEKAWSQSTTFKELLDTCAQGQMDELCQEYEGFYTYAKLMEMLAQGIADGTIEVPPGD